MKQKTLRIKYATLIVVMLLSLLACVGKYDPPPAILGSGPAANETMAGDADIAIRFTEPVDPSTLEANLWRRVLDEEWELCPPCSEEQSGECASRLAGPCRPGQDCPGAVMTLEENDTLLRFDPEEELDIGPYLLRLSPGLADRQEGRTTGAPLDLKFSVSLEGLGGPTGFQSGVLITWMELEEPISFKLDLYWHISVDSNTGEVHGSGCDADPKNPGSESRDDHRDWKPVPYAKDGYHFAFYGIVNDVDVQDESGASKQGYYFETSPLYIYSRPPLEVEVMDGVVRLTIVYDEALGRDEVKGEMRSKETYIFDTPEHSHPYAGHGIVYGYRLTEEEIALEIETDADKDAWDICASTEDVSGF